MAQSPATSRPLVTKGVGFSGYNYSTSKSPKATAATVTPTSTPPIRVSPSTRRKDIPSPSPLAEQAQKQYYEDSTWRMYDRIQASRPPVLSAVVPPKHCLIPPLLRPHHSSLSSAPRYTNALKRGPSEEATEYFPSGDHHRHQDNDDELIFDLEL